MNKQNRVLSLFFLVCLNLSCSRSSLQSDFEFQSKEVDSIFLKTSIPTGLWRQIESDYALQLNKSTSDIEFRNVELVFYDMGAFLAEKTPGLLRTGNVHLIGSQSGLFVDFADYFTAHSDGQFYLSLVPQMDLPENYKVYFASHYQKSGEMGLGCDAFADVTDYFRSVLGGPGVLASTTKQAHLFLLGGTFMIVHSLEDEMYIGQATFVDSRQDASHLCAKL